MKSILHLLAIVLFSAVLLVLVELYHIQTRVLLVPVESVMMQLLEDACPLQARLRRQARLWVL